MAVIKKKASLFWTKIAMAIFAFASSFFFVKADAATKGCGESSSSSTTCAAGMCLKAKDDPKLAAGCCWSAIEGSNNSYNCICYVASGK